MTLFLLALLAVALGYAIDARRRLAAERERHAAEIKLARTGWVACAASAREQRLVAAAWRSRAAEWQALAEATASASVGDVLELLGHDGAGMADPAAVTSPRLGAIEEE